jgi:hypothetical protein
LNIRSRFYQRQPWVRVVRPDSRATCISSVNPPPG